MVYFYVISRRLLNNKALDAILAHTRKKEIKAYFSRNLVHFHYPDNTQSLLHLLLKSVQGMDIMKKFEFFESQFKISDTVSTNLIAI